MTITIPDSTVTTLIERNTDRLPKKFLWMQNFDLSNGVCIKAIPGSNVEEEDIEVGAEFFIPPAQSESLPATFATDVEALVNTKWIAKQTSGSSVNLNVGRY